MNAHINKRPSRRPGRIALAAAAALAVSPAVAFCLDAPTSAEAPAAKAAADEDASAQPKQPTITQEELNEISDRMILLAVQDEILRSEAIDGHRIDVDVDDGIVTLSGRVDNLLTKQIAVGLAERIRGAVSVIDEMELKIDRRDDAELLKDVQAALQHDPATRHLKLTVKAESGTV